MHSALKTYTRQLIAAVGGLDAAASCCRVGRSSLSGYQDHASEQCMPIDVVLALEAVAGRPIVTAAMASLQGYSLARPDAGSIPCVGRAVAAVTRQAGAAAAAFMEASEDGRIDASEAAEMRRLLEAVREHVGEALAGLPVLPSLRAVA